VLTGEASEHRSYVIAGYHEAADRCVRTKEWSYVRGPGDQPDELYNLIEDPRETRNLIDERRDVALRLAAALGRHFFREPMAAVKGLQARYELG